MGKLFNRSKPKFTVLLLFSTRVEGYIRNYCRNEEVQGVYYMVVSVLILIQFFKIIAWSAVFFDFSFNLDEIKSIFMMNKLSRLRIHILLPASANINLVFTEYKLHGRIKSRSFYLLHIIKIK